MQRPPGVEFKRKNSRNIVRYCRGLAVVLLAWLGGCQDAATPQSWVFGKAPEPSVHDLGTVHIAALSIGPWEDFVDLLQPHFVMTASTALENSLPITSAEQSIISTIFEAHLKAGASFGASNPPQLATTPGKKPEPNSSPNWLPDLSLQVDPILNYETATALYQEVNLLNTYVKYAALKKGYIPYLVRLQVSVTAFRSNEPYDVYVDLGMFAACKTDGEQKWDEVPADVIPLLVTDNIEMQRKSDFYYTVSRLAGSLGFTWRGFGLESGADKTREDSQNAQNNGRNSVHNVSLVEENVLQVRFGAPYSPKTSDQSTQEAAINQSMQTQTHDVSFVLLVDPRHAYGRSLDNEKCNNKQLTIPNVNGAQIVISTYFQFRNSKKGIISPTGPAPIFEATRKILKSYLKKKELKKFDTDDNLDNLLHGVDFATSFAGERKLIYDFCNIVKNFDNDEYSYKNNGELIYNYIIKSQITSFDVSKTYFKNFNEFVKCIKDNFKDVEDFITALAPVAAMSTYNKAEIDIPPPREPAPLAQAQATLIQDDCKTKAIAIIPGLNGLFHDRFNASLHLADGIVVLANSITTGIDVANNSAGATSDGIMRDSDGTLFVVQFPSLGPLLRATSQSGACGTRFSAQGAAAIKLKGAQLWMQEVVDRPTDPTQCTDSPSADDDPYPPAAIWPDIKKDRCFAFKTIFYEKLPDQPDNSKQSKNSAQSTTQPH